MKPGDATRERKAESRNQRDVKTRDREQMRDPEFREGRAINIVEPGAIADHERGDQASSRAQTSKRFSHLTTPARKTTSCCAPAWDRECVPLRKAHSQRRLPQCRASADTLARRA